MRCFAPPAFVRYAFDVISCGPADRAGLNLPTLCRTEGFGFITPTEPGDDLFVHQVRSSMPIVRMHFKPADGRSMHICITSALMHLQSLPCIC